MKLPFEEYRDLINRYLDDHIFPEDSYPIPIHQAMRYSLFAGGKRLRPALVLLAGESLGGSVKDFLPIAAAIEMIHTYSLIHDDLPCMDNDDFRRGKPTNHRVFGEALAILAGDALLTAGIHQVSQSSYAPEIRCELISRFTEAIGTQGMIGGQVLDILGESRTLDRVELEQIHAMKTAALIGFSACAPAIILQKGPETERAFAIYGESIGLAFQIIDDILDVEGTTQTLGKTAGKDQNKGKATYPSILGMEESKRLAEDLVETGSNAVQKYDQLGYLVEFAKYILNRKH